MANLKFNTNNIRRVPINRNSLFYDAETFALEREIGKDYIEQDMGQTVVLYQVDASQTQTDAVYGESSSDEVAFKTPVEIRFCSSRRFKDQICRLLDRISAGAAVFAAEMDIEIFKVIIVIISVPAGMLLPVNLIVVNRVGFAAPGQSKKQEYKYNCRISKRSGFSHHKQK